MLPTLYVDLSASSIATALVTSDTNFAPRDSLPELVLGDTGNRVSVAFVDSVAGGFHAISSAPGYLITVGVGIKGETEAAGSVTLGAPTDNIRSGLLLVTTQALATLLGTATLKEIILEVQITDPAGLVSTVLQFPIHLVGQVIPNADTFSPAVMYRVKDGLHFQLKDATSGKWRTLYFDEGNLHYGEPED